MVTDTEAIWMHIPCGGIDWFSPEWEAEDGSCDHCEGTEADPSLWQLLYVRLEHPDP
jgi:hypothetical protein